MFMSAVINLLLTAERDVTRIYVTVCLYYSFNTIVEIKRRPYARNNQKEIRAKYSHEFSSAISKKNIVSVHISRFRRDNNLPRVQLCKGHTQLGDETVGRGAGWAWIASDPFTERTGAKAPVAWISVLTENLLSNYDAHILHSVLYLPVIRVRYDLPKNAFSGISVGS